MASEPTPWLPLGELLVERRLLSRRQLELALQEHQRTGRRLGEVLVSYGFVSEQALASTLLEQVGLMDAKPVRREGQREGRWVLLDYIDIVVHVQHEDERTYYALERIWRDCPVIPMPETVTSGQSTTGRRADPTDTGA